MKEWAQFMPVFWSLDASVRPGPGAKRALGRLRRGGGKPRPIGDRVSRC